MEAQLKLLEHGFEELLAMRENVEKNLQPGIIKGREGKVKGR